MPLVIGLGVGLQLCKTDDKHMNANGKAIISRLL